MVSRQATRQVPAVVRVMPAYPSRDEVRRRTRVPRVPDVGVRTLRIPGGGTEFDQLREYMPDDESRKIDWSSTIRSASPASARGATPAQTSSTTRLSRNTTLTLLPDSILPYLLDHHELLADIRVAIERQHPLIALKFTEVLIKRCIDLPKHSQQLIVHEVHAQPIAPFGIAIIRKNQVTGSNGVSTSSVKLHPKVHAHRWFTLILMKIYSQGTILNIPKRMLHIDPLIGRPVQARPNMDTIRNVRRSIHGLDRHLVTAHFGLVLGKIDQADRLEQLDGVR